MDPQLYWVTQQLTNTGQYVSTEMLIYQSFKPGINPFTHEIILYAENYSPLPTKGYLFRLIDKVDFGSTFATQDNLVLYPVCKNSRLLNELADKPAKWKFRKVLVGSVTEHQILGGGIAAKVRILASLYALVYFWKNGWIVSPDHMLSPIEVPKGWWIVQLL